MLNLTVDIHSIAKTLTPIKASAVWSHRLWILWNGSSYKKRRLGRDKGCCWDHKYEKEKDALFDSNIVACRDNVAHNDSWGSLEWT